MTMFKVGINTNPETYNQIVDLYLRLNLKCTFQKFLVVNGVHLSEDYSEIFFKSKKAYREFMEKDYSL